MTRSNRVADGYKASGVDVGEAVVEALENGAFAHGVVPQAAAQGQNLPPLRITDVRTILTQPAGIRLVVVKVLTSEPGLFGLGCAISGMTGCRAPAR